MIQECKTLAAYLTPLLKQPVEIIVPLSSSVIMEGFTNKTIDLAYLSSTEMCKAINSRLRRFYSWERSKEKPAILAIGSL